MSSRPSTITSFDQFRLSEPVQRAIRDARFTTPTPVQQAAIPLAIERRDILATAQTGTGKTAAFTLPMIDRLAGGRARARMPRALILEPVRELALQVQEQVNLFSAHVNLSSELFIGGVNIGPQIRRAAQPVDVMIATPGRLLDLFDRGALLLIGVEILVIDEADRMLDMGFIPDIESIVAKLPVRRQTMMLSATMPPEIGRIAKRFLQRPARVSVAPPAATTELVDQSVIHCRAGDKDRILRTLLGNPAIESALVFCNRKRTVDELVRTLRRDRVQVEPLHGDMAQPVRLKTMEAFRGGEIRVLVATDVAGRGLDVRGISHVLNYDVPTQPEDYVHHIGRTGRAGTPGTSITLAASAEREHLEAIEKLINLKIRVQRADEGAAPVISPTAEAKPRRARRIEKDASSDQPPAPDGSSHPLAHILTPAAPRHRTPPVRQHRNGIAAAPKRIPSWSETVGKARRRHQDADAEPVKRAPSRKGYRRSQTASNLNTGPDKRPAAARTSRGSKSFRDSEHVPAFLRPPPAATD